MLSKTEFDVWCNRLNLSHQSQQIIERIRSSEPSRSVGGGSKNVFGRYPSQKMGVTIQFESHKVELPFIHQLEHDEDVLEFYDQPPSIKLDYKGRNGRNLGVLHTPDFFVIRNNSAGWEECKTQEKLKKLSDKSPNRYIYDEDNLWFCPPGVSYARQFGLYYRLRSDSEINWNLQRNLVFLEDYLRTLSECEDSHQKQILKVVSAQPGINLSELLSYSDEIESDDIYTLIASEAIYVDLNNTLLAEPNKCPIFLDKQTQEAYALMFSTSSYIDDIDSPVINLTIGESIIWDGKALVILHVGETKITLRGEEDKLIELKQEQFKNLVKQGKITNVSSKPQQTITTYAWDKFYQASPQDQAEALRRYKTIKPYLQGHKSSPETTPARTIRDWKAKYLTAQQKYGCGYLGLLSHSLSKGNRQRKLPQSTLEIIDKFISEDYETLKQKSLWSVYCSLVSECQKKSIIAPSYKTFSKEVKKRSKYKQTLKRQGRRAAYEKETFYWELSRTTPKHGDRPFEISHIDHTQLDVELVCSQTGCSLGRPWVTFLIDAYSRRILAVYLTFDAPSYRSCLMVLRVCVQRYGRLPQTVVVDNGAEFHSTYFETLLATFECTKKHRPPAKGRFGSVCERLFGTNNTQFIYNLMGNTQIMGKVRQVTKSVNPKNQAIWTLGVLYQYLSKWAYDVYDTEHHPAFGQSPQECFAAGLMLSGSRTNRMIPYDENFKILTLPTTSRGKAKIQMSRGVKINSIYYWSNLFKNPEIENKSVPVRYDPFNVGIAYAYIQGHWVECISQYYSEFQGHSEKELKIATSELRKRTYKYHKQSKTSAKKLADFLSSVEAEEILLEQRLHDAEAEEVFKVIEGGKAFKPSVMTNITSDDLNLSQKENEEYSSDSDLTLVVYEEF